MPFDDDTYGWAYAPPSHLEGEPEVQAPEKPPGAEIAPNQPVRLPSGVVAYRQTYAEHDRIAALDAKAQQAKRASEQAAMDAQMFAQMSRVATSVKDIEIAKRSIDMMGLQRDIESGLPIHDAVARHPMALGSGFGSALQHTAPVPASKVVQPAGNTPGYIQDPRGVPHFFPGSGKQPDFTPRQVELPNTKLVQVGPNRYQQIRPPETLESPKAIKVGDTDMVQIGPNRFQQVRKPVEGKLTDQQKARISDLRNQRKGLTEEMTGFSWEARVRAGGPENEKYIADKNAKVSAIDSEIAKIEGLAPAPQAAKPVAVIGQGTKVDPAKPTSDEQFASLPSGAWFINPKDGKLMQKK